MTQSPPTRLDKQSFDKEVERLWPEASHVPLSSVGTLTRLAMWESHRLLGLQPISIVAGFAHALKSKALR